MKSAVVVQKILDLLDALSPPLENASVEDRRRARLLVTATLFGGSILIVTGLDPLRLAPSARITALNVSWGVATLSLVLVARRVGSLNLLANSLVAIVFVHTLILSTLAGGRNVGALFAFSVYPLVAVLVAGWKAGLVFTGLSAAAVLLSPLTPTDWLARKDFDPAPIPGALVRDALNVIFTVGFLSALYDAVRNSTLRDARNARAQAEESQEQARESGERQQRLIEISNRLHDASYEDFEAELQRAMDRTAELAGADRSVLRLIQGSEVMGRFAHGEDSETFRNDVNDLTGARRDFEWSAKLIGEGRIAQCRRPNELPAEATGERAYFEERRTVSWLCVPILARRSLIGWQSFETLHEEKTWSEAECNTLRLLTEILGSAVIRHRTERALRESELKFAGAFRKHPDAMFIMDLETDEILECNDRWLDEMATPDRDDVIGRKPWEFGFSFPDDHLAAIRRMLIDQGHTPAVEVSLIGRNGDQRTYLISATRIDVGGRPCALANVHDLTGRKQLEQQLLQAQKMEAVGRLAGGIAHDFNNMLTVISGYSSSLMQNLEGEDRRDAEEIHEAARRSADLTRQLLAFSRRQTLRTEVIDVNEVVTGVESMLRPLIDESIELRIQAASEPLPVRTDRGQLEQAVVNLVVNARDAMPEGGTLTVETGAKTHAEPTLARPLPAGLAPGSYAVLTVIDDGKGMDPDLIELVMEPFYTTKPEGQGTGLGLPMVHGVARQCGGTLILSSEPGRGTCAEIHLPLADEHGFTVIPLGAPQTALQERPPHRVLLVEDEPTLRRLAARSLRSAGYEVVEAENGAHALERAGELGEAIDIVLSDVVMPKLSGIELVRRLRVERPDLPVVLMSGYPDAAGDGAAIPDDLVFLQKPFEPPTLLDALRTALESKSEDLAPIDAPIDAPLDAPLDD